MSADVNGTTRAGPVTRRTARACAALLATLLLAAPLPAGARAQAAVPAPAPPDAAACEALKSADLTALRDAPLVVTAAEVVAKEGSPAVCRVRGYVRPEIRFDLRLPLSGWKGRFLLAGSGGWAVDGFTFLCRPALERGYACIAGDAGHQTRGGLWWQSDPQSKIDWGFLATHKLAVAGKALLARFYGHGPELSLMEGCSTGGYQTLVEAQRFPWDFNGLIADSPDIDEGDLNMRTVWAARNFADEHGRPLFTTVDLAVLHQAALEACDMSDGVRDGVVGDPLACRFDPAAAACKPGQLSGCLSPRQVLAARRIYAGPSDSRGESLSTAGPLPGSEMGWPDFLEDVSLSNDLFRFALGELPRDGVSADGFDFDEDSKRLGLLGTFVDSNPDLRRFQRAGGKLLLIQGGNDVTEQAHATVDYYDMVTRVSGGRTRDFARLFVVPGMNHCSGGDGAFAIDYLAAMEAWAGGGGAPERLVGAHAPSWEKGNTAFEAGLTTPSPGTAVTFTRPVFPYPAHAVFRGRGDSKDADNYVPSISR